MYFRSAAAFFLLLFVASASSGCILAPFVASFKDMGATPADRQRLLNEDMKRYSELLSWGKPSEAADYATEEYRATLFEDIRDIGDEEKVVETKVKDVAWGQDAYEASVNAEVRYFRVPYYVVETRRERQQWTFGISSGWKLKERVVEESKKK